MISVVVLYPNQPGSRFDMDRMSIGIYCSCAIGWSAMGMRSMTYIVERAMDPSAPAQAYRLAADLRFDDMESVTRALQAHGAETQVDIPNFTDVAPVILIGEVKLG